jgi:taurine dioxygenase
VAKHPPLLHPVVRTHPVTGKQALFVNEGFTTRIVDVTEKESEALLSFLFAHITKPEFQVRWRWQENDLAIWDNRVTQHYANADYLPQRRIMQRATILGISRFTVRLDPHPNPLPKAKGLPGAVFTLPFTWGFKCASIYR